MRIVLPIVYFRRSIAAQEEFAQKVKECLMARTLDLIGGYMFSHLDRYSRLTPTVP